MARVRAGHDVLSPRSERRLKAGEAVRVKDYLRRYPELAGDRVVVRGLVSAARVPLASRPGPGRN